MTVDQEVTQDASWLVKHWRKSLILLAVLAVAWGVWYLLAPAWALHLTFHYLALLRHELAGTFAWEPVKTNIGAGFYWAAIAGVGSAALYPPLKAAITKHWALFHAKLDHIMQQNAHIIKHTKSIPDASHDGKVLTADHEGNQLA